MIEMGRTTPPPKKRGRQGGKGDLLGCYEVMYVYIYLSTPIKSGEECYDPAGVGKGGGGGGGIAKAQYINILLIHQFFSTHPQPSPLSHRKICEEGEKQEMKEISRKSRSLPFPRYRSRGLMVLLNLFGKRKGMGLGLNKYSKVGRGG